MTAQLFLVVQRYREGRKRFISRWITLARDRQEAVENVHQEDGAQIIPGFPLLVEEYGSSVVSGRTHEIDRYPTNWKGPF
jgi:hypothetical protein